jgi:predicted metal-binding membrane protein
VSYAPDTRQSAGAPSVERLLRRDRAITAACLIALCVLAWAWVLTGAGTGMSVWAMTVLSLFPHVHGANGAAALVWPAGYWAVMVAMWWIMMIAMMVPSAAPTILLYTSVQRHAPSGAPRNSLAPTGVFIAGYLLAWLAFSLAATVVQWSLERHGLLAVATMGSRSRWLSAAILTSAGVYQLLPLKNACLAHCRSPASFLSRHWRSGAAGALRLGILHGAYCLGCCWLLMALLFVGGVMNVVWIAVLTVLVLIEKVFRAGPWASRCAGIILLAWGFATLAI